MGGRSVNFEDAKTTNGYGYGNGDGYGYGYGY